MPAGSQPARDLSRWWAEEPGTLTDLLADARYADFPVTRRLLRDWVAVGLLDHPKRQARPSGRGSSPALWSVQQRTLFRLLVVARPGAGTSIRPLLQLPVHLWLWEGDEFVPTGQAARALSSWATPLSQRAARDIAREVLSIFGGPELDRVARAAVVERVAEALYFGQSDRDQLASHLKDAFGSAAAAPILDVQVTPETYARCVQVRVAGLLAARRAARDDQVDLATARVCYREAYGDLAKRALTLAAAAGTPGLDDGPLSAGAVGELSEQAISAHTCRNLATLLGLLAEARPAAGHNKHGAGQEA